MESIKDIRESKRLSQVEVAKRLDIDTQNYHRLEKRGKKLSIEQLENIAHALEVSIFDILGKEQNTSNQENKELRNKIDQLETDIRKKDELFSVLLISFLEVTAKLQNNGGKLGLDFQDEILKKYGIEKEKKGTIDPTINQ